jgi:hypothetical protein
MSVAKPSAAAIAEPYFRFSAAEKQHFLTAFIENMTIEVRDAYQLDPEPQAAKLKAWNELLHRVVGNLREALRNSSNCFPDDVLFAMIRDTAPDEPFRSQIEWAIQNAYEYVEKLDLRRHQRTAKSAARN